MATLEELLALLPDNDTGAIDAADLRTIVTALWDNETALNARVAALEANPDTGGGTGPSVTGFWQLNPQTGAVPGGKQITADAFPLSDATWLRFDPTDQQNVDMTPALLVATRMYIQQKQDSSNWARLDTSGQAVDHGTYVEVPVIFLEGSGTVAQAGWQDVVVVLTAEAP